MPPACGEPERTEPGRRSGRLPARDAASDARLFVRAPQPVGIDPTRSVGLVLDIAFDCVVAFDIFHFFLGRCGAIGLSAAGITAYILVLLRTGNAVFFRGSNDLARQSVVVGKRGSDRV